MGLAEDHPERDFHEAPEGELCEECNALAYGMFFNTYGFDEGNDAFYPYYLCEKCLKKSIE